MTKFLLRLFFRRLPDPADPASRGKIGIFSGIVGIFCNLLLFTGKLIVGLASRSVSITADAMNNLSDATSSIVTLVGFRLAERPADEDHPYGHARYEYLSGLAVAALIVVIGFELARTSFEKILHPTPVEFSLPLVLVLAGSIGVKLWMYFFNRGLGKFIGSQTLMATAADSRNDVISTGAVLLACIVGQLTGLKIDGYVGLLVALFILWSGVGIAKDTIDPLIGAKPDESLVHAIAYLMTSHPNILGIHDLMVHDYGPGRRFASVHAELDHRIDPLVAHEILDEIERQAKRDLHVDLVIHYDPIVTDDPEVTAVHTRVTQILRGIDPRLSIHDFRMVSGPHHANVIFDMVIPAEYEDKTAQLRREVEAQLQDGKKVYHLVITFDTAAFNEMTKEAQG
jgi:cation diffusion facilitator family transporter